MASLRALLREHYGFFATHVKPGPRGFVAETFVARTADERYFAKLIPSRYSTLIEAALPVQRELHDGGIQEMSYPIPTLTGALSVTLERDILVVNNFIDGRWTPDFPFDAYVDLIARVHAADVRSAALPETFEDDVLPGLEAKIATIRAARYDDPSQQSLQRLVADRADELAGDIERYRELMAEIRSGPPRRMVITHHDGPGNVLVDRGGRIFLVDWDDILRAPPERDTWYHVHTETDEAAFLDLYRHRFPDYEVDRPVYAFYLHNRYVEDLDWMIDRILAADATDADRAKQLALLGDELESLRRAVRAWARGERPAAEPAVPPSAPAGKAPER